MNVIQRFLRWLTTPWRSFRVWLAEDLEIVAGLKHGAYVSRIEIGIDDAALNQYAAARIEIRNFDAVIYHGPIGGPFRLPWYVGDASGLQISFFKIDAAGVRDINVGVLYVVAGGTRWRWQRVWSPVTPPPATPTPQTAPPPAGPAKPKRTRKPKATE